MHVDIRLINFYHYKVWRNTHMSLSLIDILFLITVALLAFNGFSNGAVTSLVNLISIPLGFAVAYLFGPRFTLLLAANGLPATPIISYAVFCLKKKKIL